MYPYFLNKVSSDIGLALLKTEKKMKVGNQGENHMKGFNGKVILN